MILLPLYDNLVFDAARAQARQMNSTTADPRRPLSCARCGTTFDCGLGADCWCAAEPFQLPMTVSPVSRIAFAPLVYATLLQELVRKAPPRL